MSDFLREYLKKSIGCQHHDDQNPSAFVNETNVYCFTCQEAFYYRESTRQYDLNAQEEERLSTALNTSANKSPIRQFLKKRGLNLEKSSEFKLGFDQNTNCLVFPIKNIKGKTTGFGYRKIEDPAQPKYINSHGPDQSTSSVFEKSNNLYGIHTLKDPCEALIICEGYIDALKAYQHGFKDNLCFVALMGTALSENHIPPLHSLIKSKKIRSISLMLDNDEAGQNGTLKAIKTLLEGGIFPCVIFDFEATNDWKDIDELLSKKDGKDRLSKLLKDHSHDWLDYLLKLNPELTNEELTTYIDLIGDKKTKGKYATKLCERKNLFERSAHKKREYPNILSLESDKVKAYFLKEESYCNIDLPKYFTFTSVLNIANNWLNTPFKTNDNLLNNFKQIDNANYTILTNKDGEFAWRRLQLIHPLLYVGLVDVIESNWNMIKEYFLAEDKTLREKITCHSLPVDKMENQDRFSNNTPRQIITWWENIEQESIKKSLTYRYLIHTDIVDCYGSIYTHAIPQALMGTTNAKDKRKFSDNYANQIDFFLQCMNYGQTNGIPQGSVLMDFIAEIVLHDIDKKLHKKCDKLDYFILRYRDDYRIFANEVETAKTVLKHLGEILAENGGMRLSAEKTKVEDCLITGSIKKDKLFYFETFKDGETLNQHILNVFLFSKKHPNSGSLQKVLKRLKDKITLTIGERALKILENQNSENPDSVTHDFDPIYCISILCEIMRHNPKIYPVTCAILYDILAMMDNETRKSALTQIRKKMAWVPNNEMLRIWLERAVYIPHKNTEEWHKFYENCNLDENKTLLLKAFNNETLWHFPSDLRLLLKFNLQDILTEEIKAILKRAQDKEEQDPDVNKPFDEDEHNKFAVY